MSDATFDFALRLYRMFHDDSPSNQIAPEDAYVQTHQTPDADDLKRVTVDGEVNFMALAEALAAEKEALEGAAEQAKTLYRETLARADIDAALKLIADARDNIDACIKELGRILA